MQISAFVRSNLGGFEAQASTNGITKSVVIPPKSTGFGSSVNGGEALFLALATCYCNDVFREAAREGMVFVDVSVDVKGEFGGLGQPARNVTYSCKAKARDTSIEEAERLLRHTDTVAEIQNTLRQGMPVVLTSVDVEIVD